MLKKLFGFNPAKTTVRTEILAGITTFLTMSYILAINPAMFSELNMPAGAVFTSTALSSLLPSLQYASVMVLPLLWLIQTIRTTLYKPKKSMKSSDPAFL